jgi:hypothetical protein
VAGQRFQKTTSFPKVQMGTDGEVYRHEAVPPHHLWHKLALGALLPPEATAMRGDFMVAGDIGKLKVTVEFEVEVEE